MTDTVLAHRKAGLLRLTLNRPEKANALNAEMRSALSAHFRAASEDERLRAVVITGAGDKVFCAGADLDEVGGFEDASWDEMSTALSAIPVLTVAAINGHCIGGGISLALGCDIRLAVPGATFAYPVLSNEVIPSEIDRAKLRALLGLGRTAMLILGGLRVNSDEAIQWALVDRVVPSDGLSAAVSELCGNALNSDRRHLARLKRLCRGD